MLKQGKEIQMFELITTQRYSYNLVYACSSHAGNISSYLFLSELSLKNPFLTMEKTGGNELIKLRYGSKV